MHKQIFIVMLICLRGVDYISAQQWTKKDSVWLQNVLSGKEKLELNPETMKAIQSGSFINLDEPASNMKISPVTPLPILKDFTEYIQTDSAYRKKALKDLHQVSFGYTLLLPEKYYQSINICSMKSNGIRSRFPAACSLIWLR